MEILKLLKVNIRSVTVGPKNVEGFGPQCLDQVQGRMFWQLGQIDNDILVRDVCDLYDLYKRETDRKLAQQK